VHHEKQSKVESIHPSYRRLSDRQTSNQPKLDMHVHLMRDGTFSDTLVRSAALHEAQINAVLPRYSPDSWRCKRTTNLQVIPSSVLHPFIHSLFDLQSSTTCSPPTPLIFLRFPCVQSSHLKVFGGQKFLGRDCQSIITDVHRFGNLS